jgi:hypothetical protein
MTERHKNMEMSEYGVDRRMIPPVAISMVLGAWLIVLEGASERGLLMVVLLLPFYYLGLEILVRKISLDSQGITVRKLLRSVHMRWSDVTSLDAIQARNKLYIILQTEEGRPTLITNTISPFVELGQNLLENVPQDKIAQGTREMLSAPPSKLGPLIQAWIICAVLGGIIIGKFLGLE